MYSKKELGRAVGADWKRRGLEKRNLEHVTFRMDPEDVTALRRHFDAEGIPFGTGLRMAVKSWMRDNLR